MKKSLALKRIHLTNEEIKLANWALHTLREIQYSELMFDGKPIVSARMKKAKIAEKIEKLRLRFAE